MAMLSYSDPSTRRMRDGDVGFRRFDLLVTNTKMIGIILSGTQILRYTVR